MPDFTRLREQMVQRQLGARGIHDQRVLDAMRTVPRETFVLDAYRDLAYRDSPLPIEESQTISQPYIVALMAQELELEPGDRLLEVGAGSGYAAAVCSRIVAQVFAIEYHEHLASLARERAVLLGYDNIQVMHGDGNRGWPEFAPFDAILVSAGGADVPPMLLQQLKVGGRMVIPVGDRTHSQELLRIRRVEQHRYEQEGLGRVQFVPLIGSEGWSAGEPTESAREPVPTFSVKRSRLAQRIERACEPFDDIEHADLDSLLDRIGHARVVLIGECTHGTSQFYRMRARITQELITRRGFNVVAIEADWPDTSMIDRYVRGWDGEPPLKSPFTRFPAWMWRNREMLGFVQWLAGHNHRIHDEKCRTSIHGLDIYSLYHSIATVLDYLDRVDPAAAERARARYACFSPWEAEPAIYGRAVVAGEREDCEQEVLGALTDLLKRRLAYTKADGEALFDTEQNAKVIQSAEKYYRMMYFGSRESWNLRDQHMFQTLRSVLEHRGRDARAVVWAHNSHVGNAAATEMGMRGELNVGQLVREAFGEQAYLIGFGTDHGDVAAASDWDAPMQVMRLNPSLSESYERIFHEVSHERFLLPLRHSSNTELAHELSTPRLQRAIGVIYRPQTERVSHYFQAVLPTQFDEYVWFDETRAVALIAAQDLQGLDPQHPLR